MLHCFTESLLYTNFVQSDCIPMIGNKFKQMEPWYQLSGMFSPHKYTFPSPPHANMFLTMVLQWYLLYIEFYYSVSELHPLCSKAACPWTQWHNNHPSWEQIHAANSVILASSGNSTFAMGWLHRNHLQQPSNYMGTSTRSFWYQLCSNWRKKQSYSVYGKSNDCLPTKWDDFCVTTIHL